MKTDYLVKHDEKNHWSCNNNTSEINNETVWHAIRTSDEKSAKSIHKNNSEFSDKLDAQDLRDQKLHDITAYIEHHQNLW